MAGQKGLNFSLSIMAISLLLGGCLSDQPDTSHLFNTRADYLITARPVSPPVPAHQVTDRRTPYGPAVVPDKEGQAVIAAYRARKNVSGDDCSLGDRFDRSADLAYDFSDGKSRLALDLDVEGLDWDSVGSFEVNEVMLRYRFRFQGGQKPDERCRVASPLQGLIGSVYNELTQREGDTVWKELDDRGAFFWRD